MAVPALASWALGSTACSGDDSGQPDVVVSEAGDEGDAVAADAPTAVDAGTITFSATGSMHVARIAHTATLMPDGRVLVVGGEDASRTPIDSIEIYDPATAKWTELGHLPQGRSNHTATLLPDGTVLVVGGGRASDNGLPTGVDVTDSAVLVDPSPDAGALVTPTDSLKIGRSHHVAVALPDGNVLVAGGVPSSGDAGGLLPPLDEAEIYDVGAHTWTQLSSKLGRSRAMATAALVSGKALVAGGFSSDTTTPSAVDVFDPATKTFSSGADLGIGRIFGPMVALAGASSAVIVGGLANGKLSGQFLDEAELLSAGSWQSSGSLGGARDGVAVVALADGRAVALGGFTDEPTYAALAQVETFVPAEGAWYATGALAQPRFDATATLLKDGRILVAAGYGQLGPVTTCELSSVP